MTLQSIPGGLTVPYYPNGNAFASLSNLLIDATGEQAAFIVEVPQTGTITSVGFRTNTVTTSQTLRVSLQTLNASNNPSGTLYGGSAAGTQAAPASNTYYEVTLATPATATRGDFIAIVIGWDSTVGSANIGYNGGGTVAENIPFAQLFTSSWASVTGFPICSLGYGGIFGPVRGCWPWLTPPTLQGFAAGSTPNEYALGFQLPFPATASGFWGMFAPGNPTTASCSVNLYQGTTLLATLSLPGSLFAGATSTCLVQSIFPATVNLVANTQYYLSVLAIGSTNLNLNLFTVADAAHMGAFSGGTNFTLATRAGGAWTTVSTQRPMLGLSLDSFDDGTGGGGGGYSRARVVGGI